jgi:lipid II isoglutaminyl synthase (glutamine-hydrolysing)
MLIKIKVFLILIVSRLLAFLSVFLKKGQGTSIPGLIVEKYFVSVLRFFNKKYKQVIFISGTNGKTTTRAILVDQFEKNNISVCTNRGGANIVRGLASALFLDLRLNLSVKSEYLVLEVEEASLPKIKEYISCDYLILTNVFRDQLDAYGEIDNTLEYFNDFLSVQNCNIVINGDDPKLLEIVPENSDKNFVFCGVVSDENPQYEGMLKVKVDYNYLSTDVKYTAGLIEFNINNEPYITKLSGVYNLYNIMFAVVIAKQFNLKFIKENIQNFNPVFGRGEVFRILEHNTTLYLVKNPEGFNQVLQYVKKAYANTDINLFFLVNDNIADSRDVSWLWDVEFEKYRLEFLKNKVNIVNTFVGGSRADDILLRLEYADFHSISYGNNLGDISFVVDNIKTLDSTNIVFATYTAMLEFRNELSRITNVTSITNAGS